MENVVNLNFDKTLSNLAGFDFGVKTFKEQMEGKLDITKEFKVKFPPNIKGAASSFVQGLFAEIINSIGVNKTKEYLQVISENKGFDAIIISKLT